MFHERLSERKDWNSAQHMDEIISSDPFVLTAKYELFFAE